MTNNIVKNILSLTFLFYSIFLNSFVSYRYLINENGNKIFLLGDDHAPICDLMNVDHTIQLCDFFDFVNTKIPLISKCIYEYNTKLGIPLSQYLKKYYLSPTFKTLVRYIERSNNNQIEFIGADPRSPGEFSEILNFLNDTTYILIKNNLDQRCLRLIKDDIKLTLNDIFMQFNSYEDYIQRVTEKYKYNPSEYLLLLDLLTQYLAIKIKFRSLFYEISSDLNFKKVIFDLIKRENIDSIKILEKIKSSIKKFLSIYQEVEFCHHIFKHINLPYQTLTILISGEIHANNISELLVTYLNYRVHDEFNMYNVNRKSKNNCVNLNQNFLIYLLQALANCFEINYPKKFLYNQYTLKRYCNNCLKPESENNNLKKCSICFKAHYCDIDCEVEDWVDHKKLCNQFL